MSKAIFLKWTSYRRIIQMAHKARGRVGSNFRLSWILKPIGHAA
jgi:hypothetical protein